jgi:hypothetical protein
MTLAEPHTAAASLIRHNPLEVAGSRLERVVKVICLVTLFAATTGHAQASKRTLAVDCASLKGFSIPPSAIALPTSGALVQAAEPVAADAEQNLNGGFCKVATARRCGITYRCS